MDREIIRAYLLQDVIRLGFTPASIKDQKNWLLQYGYSLKDFWEVNEYPKAPRESSGALCAVINSSKVNLKYDYAIENINKFNINFLHIPNEEDNFLIWTHDLDRQYFIFPNQKFLNELNVRKGAIRESIDNDIKKDIGAVIDTLLIHPTPHQHILSPIKDHEIRIGGGMINPFQYLFHLRIQLCPIEDKKEAERSRLIGLFQNAITNNVDVSISELMKVPIL